MRRVLILALVLFGLWSVYWVVAAQGLQTGIGAWLDARRAEGWVADLATMDVAGYPARLDTTLRDLTLADPETGLAWSAPLFRLQASAARPTRITAIWPETQQVATPLEKIAVGAARMEGVLAFRPGPALELTEGAYLLDRVSLASSAGWQASVGHAEVTSDLVEDRENTHRIGLSAEAMRPPMHLVALLDRAGLLPALFEHVRLNAVVAFDAPWDRHAIEDRRPQVTRIELTKLDAKWGDLELQAAGDLEVDAEGRPSGTLTVRATNWRQMVQIARASGRLPQGLADQVENALGLLAGLSGRPETLDAPLRFALGQTWLGPVPLGPAPDFTLR